MHDPGVGHVGSSGAGPEEANVARRFAVNKEDREIPGDKAEQETTVSSPLEIEKRSLPVRQWIVLSGKGGTGKTSLVAAFARLAGRLVVADADVDAANLSLALEAERRSSEDFFAGVRARIDESLCAACGTCLEVCRFGAVIEGETYSVDPLECEGCGACAVTCPSEAVSFTRHRAGDLLESMTPYGPMVHAELGVAEDNSGKLVAAVVENAKRRAAAEGIELVLIDGPPGIGCPVHAAVSGAEKMLAVAEPSVSGYHDLDRLLELARHFKVAAAVCVNRWDVSPEETERIEARCREIEVPVLGRVPFDREMPLRLCRGEMTPGAEGSATEAAIREIWESWRDLPA